MKGTKIIIYWPIFQIIKLNKRGFIVTFHETFPRVLTFVFFNNSYNDIKIDSLFVSIEVALCEPFRSVPEQLALYIVHVKTTRR